MEDYFKGQVRLPKHNWNDILTNSKLLVNTIIEYNHTIQGTGDRRPGKRSRDQRHNDNKSDNKTKKLQSRIKLLKDLVDKIIKDKEESPEEDFSNNRDANRGAHKGALIENQFNS